MADSGSTGQVIRRGEGPQPQPLPLPPPIKAPRDTPYPGVITLEVDARDTARGIISVRQSIPLSEPGAMTLLYPKWIPGYHSPQNPLALFAGLQIKASDRILAWRRDPVEVYAFHLEAPQDAQGLDLTFQFLSPTTSLQGDVVVTPQLSLIHWGRMLLYPAGHFARQITIAPRLLLPAGWTFASALGDQDSDQGTVQFAPVTLDTLVDSPVMAGRHSRTLVLDEEADVQVTLFAHEQQSLAASAEHAASHGRLVAQTDALFGARHYGRYRFLAALSDELGGGGVEHHRSAEIVLPPDYFSRWEENLTKREVWAHEFVHSWNGKFRQGSDSWIPDFQQPIRNSLMWVYEGLTQYLGYVLTVRSGLWPAPRALESLAKIAATYDVRPGGLWRTMADTTRDPIIAGRAPLPWPSWQRSEDYYSEGQLLWLAADTLIRERSGDSRSLDDFARAFFGGRDGAMITQTYDFEDVVRTLTEVVDYDWRRFLGDALERREQGAPLQGLARGGYRLVYRDNRSEFCRSYDAANGQFDLRFSIGLTLGDEGLVQEVMWDSAAFKAGLVGGAEIKSVNGRDYNETAISDAIEANGAPIRLGVSVRGRARDINVDYRGGHRFPHLEPIRDARRRLDEILAAR